MPKQKQGELSHGLSIEKSKDYKADTEAGSTDNVEAVRGSASAAAEEEKEVVIKAGTFIGYRRNNVALPALVVQRKPLVLEVFSPTTPGKHVQIKDSLKDGKHTLKRGTGEGQYWHDVEDLEAAIAVELYIEPLLKPDAA